MEESVVLVGQTDAQSVVFILPALFPGFCCIICVALSLNYGFIFLMFVKDYCLFFLNEVCGYRPVHVCNWSSVANNALIKFTCS